VTRRTTWQRSRSRDDKRRVVRGRRIARSSRLVSITSTSTVAPRLSTSTRADRQNVGDHAAAKDLQLSNRPIPRLGCIAWFVRHSRCPCWCHSS
jgi:hypothetical protein